MDARRGLLHRHAEARRPRSSTRPSFDLLDASRLLQGRDRGRQPACLRRDDARRRAASEGRASAGVRLRQSLRAHRQALSLGREPHPHDGGGAALHLRRDLQDHQHAERRDASRTAARPICCPGSWAQGQRALSRRLQALAAAGAPAHRRRRRGRGRRGRDARRRQHAGARGRSSPNASSSASSSASSAARAREACPTAARATRRRRSSAATRSICAPANTRTAGSAKSSSTCTRKAPPSAR